MEVGQAPNWGCSAKKKDIRISVKLLLLTDKKIKLALKIMLQPPHFSRRTAVFLSGWATSSGC
jgi:hypothetical protein